MVGTLIGFMNKTTLHDLAPATRREAYFFFSIKKERCFSDDLINSQNWTLLAL